MSEIEDLITVTHNLVGFAFKTQIFNKSIWPIFQTIPSLLKGDKLNIGVLLAQGLDASESGLLPKNLEVEIKS